MAIEHFQRYPEIFTEPVVRDMRALLGIGGSGIDVPFVDAVKRRQVTLGPTAYGTIEPDGRIDPETLAVHFPLGMLLPGAHGQFPQLAKGFADLRQKWSRPGLDQIAAMAARADLLKNLSNTVLGKAGVPEVEVEIADAATPALFLAEQWRIAVRPEVLVGAGDADIVTLAQLLSHELVHPYQQYQIARRIAGNLPARSSIDERVAAIRTVTREGGDLGMPLNRRAAEQAAHKPLRSGTVEATVADQWLRQLYPSRSDPAHTRLTNKAAVMAEASRSQEVYALAVRRVRTASGRDRADAEAALELAEDRLLRIQIGYHRRYPFEGDAESTSMRFQEYLVNGGQQRPVTPAPGRR